jgi:hypothetical protein
VLPEPYEHVNDEEESTPISIEYALSKKNDIKKNTIPLMQLPWEKNEAYI